MKPIDRVVVYGSLGLRPGLSDLLWAFRKRHKLEEFPVYLDDHPFQIQQRIEAEIGRGMRTADVVIMPHYMLLRLAEQRLLASYDTSDVESYRKRFYDSRFRWFAVAVTFMSMAYDPKRLPRQALPKALEDLSSMELRGRLGMQSLTASRAGNLGAHYIAFLKRKVGSSRWRRFVEGLAGPNKPKVYDCIDHLMQGLLDGEHRLALTVYSLAYFREKSAGSSVALLRMEDAPPMLTFTSVGLLKTAEENKSARKFIDFLLGEEAQKIIGRIPGLSPARPGFKASYPFEVETPPEAQYHPDQTDLGDVVEAVTLFERLGLP